MASLFFGSSQRVIQALQRVQNAAARVIARVGKKEHTHWLPIAHIIQYKILILTYKGQPGLAPPHQKASNLLSTSRGSTRREPDDTPTHVRFHEL